jgi:hypothetical protein
LNIFKFFIQFQGIDIPSILSLVISCFFLEYFMKIVFFMLNFRYRNPFFGSTQFQWSSVGRNLCLQKVSVAADYSDSVPDSSNYTSHRGYHPLEEVKLSKRTRETQLTSAEIARTTVEVGAWIVSWESLNCQCHDYFSMQEFIIMAMLFILS